VFQQFGEVRLDDVFEQLFQLGVLAGVIEELEMAEAHMTGRQAQQHGTALRALAVDQRIRTGDAQRSRAGNAQRMQMFAGEELANRRAQHRAAVAHA